MGLLQKLFDHEYKELKRFEKIADQIDALDEEMQKLKDSDFKAKTEGVTWYSDTNVCALAIARQTRNDAELRKALTNIYNTDVKAAARKMIYSHAAQVGVATAVSQSEKIDTLFVVAYDLSLIKDIIYLYGFRPSDSKLAKIYKDVIMDALIAYGLGSIGNVSTKGVMKTLGSSLEGIPVIGGALGTVVDSVTQGIVNGMLTVKIGYQTQKYLQKEYHLQDILEEVVLTEEEEAKAEEEMNSLLKDDIKKAVKNKKAEPQAA